MVRNDREQPEFLTRPNAAKRAGIGLRQIRRAIEAGELPVYDVGGWPRLRWSEVVAWIEDQRRARGRKSAGTEGSP